MRKIRFAAAAASALVFLSAPASAGFFDFTLAPFIGASAGQSNADISCPAGTSCDDSDFAWKLYGGLEVNEYISMEVGYIDLGEVDFSGAKTGTRSTDGWMLQFVGSYAINPSISLIGRGGLNILNTNVNGTIAGTANNNAGDNDIVWSLGLGAQYNLTKAVGLRVEWERYFETGSSSTNGGTGSSDVDLISAGVVFKF